MKLPEFDHVGARSLAGAASAVAEGAVPYCGGTELLAAMRMGLLRPERLVSLRQIEELGEVRLHDDLLHVGATATHDRVATSSIVRGAAPLLATVAEDVGNVRVRATGTIGGNLAFAEPRSDVSTVLIALGAHVRLGDGTRSRTTPVRDFLLGPYEPDLRPGELLLGIEIPRDLIRAGVYRKVTVTERPVVGVALVQVPHERWRLVVGAVADEPWAAEFDDLADVDPVAVADEMDVVSDLNGSTTYKRHLTAATIDECRDAVRSGGAA